MLRHNRRQPERGQTLILAVGFLAMFGLFAATVLGFASGVWAQRQSTERIAAHDSVAEGFAQFAIADTGVQGCGIVGTGTMHFASGDTLTYNATTGTCSSSSSSAPGQNCGLCVLNVVNCKPGSTPSQCSGNPVDVHKGDWTVPGEVDVNGSINVTRICSGTPGSCPGTGRIGLYGNGATCGSTCSPAKISLSNQILDPLAGAMPIPTAAANPPSASGGTICPGTYKDLSGTLTMDPWGSGPCAASSAPSLYIITGSMGGNSAITANGSTLYLASTASMSFSGNGNMAIDCGGPPPPATCSTPTTPTTGPYAGVAVFFDPGNTSTISFQGNGTFVFGGTFEASHAILSMGGNGGSEAFQSGRLIISEINGNGNGGAGLGFGGGLANSSGCNYWSDSLTGKLADGTSWDAHLRFESACNSGSPTSIIGFAYGNGP